ncbi:unnamed protein product [Tuber melanosporum]|uniref:(Perigord truffle) hypothetical protein n=1 Tax=Tuber melanosporum (strain Mel28) TaxID=656061 RepID=D5G518_TUBMM|nr:uncharacterized protein GSTUM_00000324001 [Tuber melanosporum]CAZ79611.1 unnamed protein product [Tuber melanosporum]
MCRTTRADVVRSVSSGHEVKVGPPGTPSYPNNGLYRHSLIHIATTTPRSRCSPQYRPYPYFHTTPFPSPY